jgi:hypothetical protein
MFMDKEKIPNILRASETLGISCEEFIFNLDERLGESEEFKQTISLLETIKTNNKRY